MRIPLDVAQDIYDYLVRYGAWDPEAASLAADLRAYLEEHRTVYETLSIEGE